MSADERLAELRAPLRGTEQLHLNNAGVSPMTRRARDAVVGLLEVMQTGSAGVSQVLRAYDASRQTTARLVGAAKDDVSFFQTAAAAISQVALGLSFAEDDEIVLVDQEYPSNAYPWHRAAERAGAKVVVVPSEPDLSIRIERVLDAIGPRTRVVAASWVQFSTGSVLELPVLAQAAHTVGAWLVVDAIQGLGVIPFDLAASGADAVCGGSHKWLLGPLGHGFFALAPGRAAQLQPITHGAMTYGTPDDAVDPSRLPRTDSRRFEPGAPLALGAVGMAASIEVLLDVGITRVHREAMELADLVEAGARSRGLEVRRSSGAQASPIVTLVPRRRDARVIVEEMRTRGCSVAPRGGGVRVSPHCHNGPQHIERLFALWDELDP